MLPLLNKWLAKSQLPAGSASTSVAIHGNKDKDKCLLAGAMPDKEASLRPSLVNKLSRNENFR